MSSHSGCRRHAQLFRPQRVRAVCAGAEESGRRSRDPEQNPPVLRIIGFAAALVSVIASIFLLEAAPASESLKEALKLLYSCLILGATLALPRRDCTTSTISGILFLLGSTLLAYSTDDLRILLAAWVVSTVPFFFEQWFGARTWRPRLALLLSSGTLALAVASSPGTGTGRGGSVFGRGAVSL
jgi:hypothetical protein